MVVTAKAPGGGHIVAWVPYSRTHMFDGVTAGLATHHSDRNSGCRSRTVSLEGGVAAVTDCAQCPVLASLGV